MTATAFAALLVLTCGVVRAEVTAKSIPWKQVPQSTLPEKMTAALTNLCGQLADKRCVIVFDEERALSKSTGGRSLGGALVEPPWNFERFAREMFLQILKECRIPCVDGSAGSAGLNEGTRQRRIDAMRKFAEDNRADVVLAVSITPDAIRLAVSSATGAQLGMTSVRLGRQDSSYFANTPATNRRMVEFGEASLGKTIGRGECWDFCSAAAGAAGSVSAGSRGFGRELDPDEVPFPGDVGHADGAHFVMIHFAQPDGTFAILHQNWLNGAPEGRKVAPGACGRKGLVLWRPGPAPQDNPLKSARASWEAAKSRVRPSSPAPAM